MRDNGQTILYPTNGTWTQRTDPAPGPCPADPDFDARCIRHLVAVLDAARFGNLAFAIMRASVQVANGEAGREEFDALVDLGIDLLARDGRPLQALRSEG
jgi:hypothetical protein